MFTACVVCGKKYEKTRNKKTCSDSCSESLRDNAQDIRIRVTPTEAGRISRHANSTGLTPAEVVRVAVEEYLARQENRGDSGGNPRVIRTLKT